LILLECSASAAAEYTVHRNTMIFTFDTLPGVVSSNMLDLKQTGGAIQLFDLGEG
jgi:hypothetical protein